jgi:hypothetical protein
MHLEGINGILDYFGMWGAVFLIAMAVCTIAVAVWLWRKI